MVKITGRTRDGAHLKAHLDYISRNGALALEGPAGERLEGRGQVRDLARDWAEEFALEPERRRDASISLSIVLSMPAGTDAVRLQEVRQQLPLRRGGEARQRRPVVLAAREQPPDVLAHRHFAL